MGSAAMATADGRQGIAGAGERPGWRSHTFADDVRSLKLVDPLDAGLAARLRTRVSELLERGCRRLVVDASAIELGAVGCALLAVVFAERSASYRAVVVTAPGTELAELLPPAVGVAVSLSDAHGQLRRGAVRRPAPPTTRRAAWVLHVTDRRSLSRR